MRVMNYALHRYVRIGEIVVVVVLSIFALMTWLELNALRKAPVVLPNYQFESLSTAEGTPMVVTRGTWIAENGPPEPLLTTTIECRKDRMECVESAALVVFVSGNVFQDYGFDETEAGCQKQLDKLEMALNEDPKLVVRYEARCVFMQDMKRPGKPA